MFSIECCDWIVEQECKLVKTKKIWSYSSVLFSKIDEKMLCIFFVTAESNDGYHIILK